MLSTKDPSHYVSKHIIYRNKNPLAPQWPFRLLITGQTGCGKTSMLRDLMLDHLEYEMVYIFAKELSEPIYKHLKKFFQNQRDDLNKKLKEANANNCHREVAFFSDDLDDVPELSEIDKKKQNLFIFDDFLTVKNQKIITDLFIRGRKRNASVVYISQSYFGVPKDIRLNCNYFAFYKINNLREMREISARHAGDIEFNKFREIFQCATKEKHTFLVIDTTSRVLFIRKCWDGPLRM